MVNAVIALKIYKVRMKIPVTVLALIFKIGLIVAQPLQIDFENRIENIEFVKVRVSGFEKTTILLF